MLVTDLSGIAPTEMPTAKPTFNWFPTLTPAPIPIPPTATSILVPAWVTHFSDPILAALMGQRPDIRDDFSPYNQGWFIVNPENSRRPFYAHVQDGALFLNLPEGTINKDLTVYNPKLLFRNFVLSFDFKFGKTEPDDMLRFQFTQAADENVAFDLSRNESWTYYWNLHNGSQSSTGAYDYFAPEFLNVVIIMRGNECAMYLNRDPVDYLSNCRPERIGKLSVLALTFHLPGSDHPAQVILDNFRLWDLDQIPNLP